MCLYLHPLSSFTRKRTKQKYSKSAIFVWYENGRRQLLGAQSIDTERASLKLTYLSRISEGSPQTPPQKEATDTHSLGRSPPGSSTRSHTSEASHGNDTSLNADEDLANKTLVTDDPSQSLASSLNAVDIHSFYGTPSPQRKPGSSSSSSMEPSFSSPVLGMLLISLYHKLSLICW